MFMMLLIVLLFSVCSSAPLTVYNNARFEPNDIHFLLDIKTSINSQIECACQCFNTTMCLTATYVGINQTCTLYFARLDQGKLYLMVRSVMTSVISFRNKTLPDPYKLTSTSETVYGIWNTTAGGDSRSSSAGSTAGKYVSYDTPADVFDRDVDTKYSAYGTCGSSYSFDYEKTCGVGTGLYLSLRRGMSLLVAFRICTAATYTDRDPITVTIEGSNTLSSALTLGSSWILIYNGSSGLDSDPGGSKFGVTKWLLNNSVWYSSYRFLVTSKRNGGNFVHYSELELLGY